MRAGDPASADEAAARERETSGVEGEAGGCCGSSLGMKEVGREMLVVRPVLQ